MTGWRCYGTSVRGPAHVEHATPNQDAWTRTRRPWGELVVVSDGVGSRPLSHYGSRAACKAVRASIRLEDGTARVALAQFTARWLALVAPFDPRECSATCLFVVRPALGPITIGALGDGLVVVTRTGGQIDFIENNKDDGFANVTEALSARTAASDWTVVEIEQDSVDSATLCTDGVADGVDPAKRAAFFRTWDDYTSAMADVTAGRHMRNFFHGWEVPGQRDDRTMVTLRRPQPGGAA